jgi:Fe2+ or Zn2+ uptake regulation protein
MTNKKLIENSTAGYSRLTPARKAIFAFFEKQNEPVDYGQILEYLEENNLIVNKTTVYRQLDSLLNKGLIQELDFGEGKKRYELSKTHHHHLVCLGCNNIQCVELSENFINQETIINKKTDFKITGHMLEFFGYCSVCQGVIK